LWNVKTKVMPTLTGATGPSQKLRKCLNNITGNYGRKRLQKTVTFVAADLLRKAVLQNKIRLSWKITLHVP